MRLENARNTAVIAAAAAMTAPNASAQFAGFSGPTFLNSGGSPTKVVIADFDGDGDLDFAGTLFTPSQFDAVEVFLNNGDGSFSAPQTYSVGSSPVGITAEDIDGDGDVDLAIANRDSGDFSVLLNNGDGTFAPEVFFAAGDSPQAVALNDFNGNGIIDAAVANSADNTVSVFFGDGTGSFTLDTTLALAGSSIAPRDIVAADFDRDGAVDLATSQISGADVNVFYNAGDGTFFSGDFAVVVGVGVQPVEIVVGDFNSDGFPDFATCNGGPDNATIRLNDASPPFSNFNNGGSAMVGDRPVGLATADLNNDGALDIVTSNEVSEDVTVLIGDGAGDFSSSFVFPGGNSPNPPALGDLDNDGDVDLIVPNITGNNYGIYLNNTNTIGGPPPVARIDAPSPFECVCDTVAVEGVVDAPGGAFDSFVLDYRDASGGSWNTIATGNTPIAEPGGLISTWNTSGVSEGFYFLRLTAANTGGLTEEDRVIVWVSQDFDTLDFLFARNGGDSITNAEIAGGNVCPYGDVVDNRCGPNEYAVEFSPAGAGTFSPVDPSEPIYSGNRLNENLAIWDSRSLDDGDYDVRVTAMNDCGETEEQTRTVTIDNTAPVAEIDSPVNCDVFTPGETITITGEIFDENLSGWSLQYTGGDTNSWTTIATGNGNVDGVIAQWDTSQLPSCAYTLRLRASDAAVVNCSPGGHTAGTLVSIDVRCLADFNGDGQVDAFDLSELLGSWGACP